MQCLSLNVNHYDYNIIVIRIAHCTSNNLQWVPKKRKYIEDYIRFRFVSLQKDDNELPQCVICYKTLSNDGMRPSRLERHLRTTHPALADKPKAFFEKKKTHFEDMESEHEALLFHTNVRWLSKGNMLGRLYELREEVAIFLDSQQKADFHDNFQSEGFQITLTYLVDIFEALNPVNLKLQGKSINIITHHDTIRAFMAKLDLWKCRVQQGNVASFRNLDSALADSNLDSDLKQQIITHLSDLKAEFIRYFPDIDDKREAWKFIRNPFPCEVADVADEVQEEFLELKFNSTAKKSLQKYGFRDVLGRIPSCLPSDLTSGSPDSNMFGSTYLCETAFSTLVAIKTKYRNRLNVEGDLRCALSSIRPHIQDLVAKKQCQISH
ncbi:zinc finger BED domain-containing protein 5-like [Macrobrachium nipponense]|uniref:zinc finger BED domain-containing protein 5-like n=1 Tax=Macrobrachium nipponense TaxID=159736 RepID=UPI0030C7C55F